MLLLVDSAAPSVVKRSTASGLAFIADRSVPSSVRIVDANERLLNFEPVLLERLEVGRQGLRDVPAGLVESGVFDLTCPPIDEFLGTGGASSTPGFLDRVAVEINRDSGRVRFAKDGSLLDAPGVTLPVTRVHSSNFVGIGLEGRGVWAEVDTGNSTLSTMTSDIFSGTLGRSVEADDVRRYIGTHGVFLGGAAEAKSWIAVIRDVQLGSYRVSSVPFRIEELRDDGIPSVVLTQSLLEYFNITLDYPRNEVRLSLAESQPASGLKLQLEFEAREGRIVVVGMIADGAAAQAGIEIGDEVVMFNHTEVTGRASNRCARNE